MLWYEFLVLHTEFSHIKILTNIYTRFPLQQEYLCTKKCWGVTLSVVS